MALLNNNFRIEMMKKKFNKTSIALLAILFLNLTYGQAKKPTIMVIPSDVWCNINGYMTESKGLGETIKVPNYKKAFQENANLLQVIAKINTLMADRGFPLKDIAAAMKTLESESAENALLSSKSGASIYETPIEKIKKVAKADIIMELTWTVNTTGPKKSITYTIKGLDAYTDKQIAGATGTGTPSFTAELPVLLEEAVLAHIDNFNSQLQAHFEDLFTNGREIIVRVKKFDSWPDDLEKEYNGVELREIISEWINENSVNHRFNESDSGETSMLFEQVRIPLFDANGKAIDAKNFLKGLQNLLKSQPYSITNKLIIKGLGQATLVLGEK
jgi:DNA-binding transcriptional MerR regulator